RQANHAMFRSDVGSDARVAGQGTDRSVVDDRAAALALHLSQFVFHAAPHPAQVTPDHAVPVLTATVASRCDTRHNTCVVEDGVELAELGDRSAHICSTCTSSLTSQRIAICLVTSCCQLLRFLLHSLLPHVGQYDGRACLGERLRGRQSHAQRCPRHECYLVFKRPIHRPTPVHWHATGQLGSSPKLHGIHNFRCPNDGCALAERANVLATRATRPDGSRVELNTVGS